MSKTRKMWAVQSWGDRRWVECSEHPAVGRVPVLVTDASDMPDFEPGDRVWRNGMSATVLDWPYEWRGEWYIAVNDSCSMPCSWKCDGTRKFPREKTVVLRVTGPEDDVQNIASALEAYGPREDITEIHISRLEGAVRVERVEDTDER